MCILSIIAQWVEDRLLESIRDELVQVIGDKEFVDDCLKDRLCRKTILEMVEYEAELARNDMRKYVRERLGVELVEYNCYDIEVRDEDKEISFTDGSIVLNVNGVLIRFSCSEWGSVRIDSDRYTA